MISSDDTIAKFCTCFGFTITETQKKQKITPVPTFFSNPQVLGYNVRSYILVAVAHLVRARPCGG